MTGSEVEIEPRLLPRLTALRWYGALAVFLFHLNVQIHWRPLDVFSVGRAGVSFFYVLSGFVLTWSIRADPSTWRFYRRRFARIYPATFATWVIAAVLVAAGALDLRGGLLGAVTSITLLQAWFPGTYPVYSYNLVAWSLSCEAFFYALLPVLIVATRTWRSRRVAIVAVLCVATGLVTTITLVHVGRGSDIAFNNPLVRLPEFLLGVALGLLVVRGWRPAPPVWLALPLLAIGAAFARHEPSWFPLEDYALLPGVAVLLLAGIGADLRRRRGLLTSRVSVYLGELSFCFYLVHFLVLRGVASAADWSQQTFSLASGVFPTILILAASIAAAGALHHGIELPMQRLLRPKYSRPVA